MVQSFRNTVLHFKVYVHVHVTVSTGSASVEQRSVSQGKPAFKVTRHTPRNVPSQRPYRMRTISSPADQSQRKRRKLDPQNVSLSWQPGTWIYVYAVICGYVHVYNSHVLYMYVCTYILQYLNVSVTFLFSLSLSLSLSLSDSQSPRKRLDQPILIHTPLHSMHLHSNEPLNWTRVT